MAQIFSVGPEQGQYRFKGASCAFGVFDGIHLGHKYLLASACQTAEESGGATVALTFDIDPDELFHPDRLKKLLANNDRLQALAHSGVDAVAMLYFTPEMAALEPREFLDTCFGDFPPAYLHVGSDFRFGAKAAGTVDDLREWGKVTGTEICVHSLVSTDGAPITSTRIRLLLEEGKVEEANALLGYPYTLADVVKPGRGEGKDLGFATANMELEPMRRVLGEGVYAARAYVGLQEYRAAVAVGVSPVFEAETTSNIEVHLLDFEGDLYGKRIEVEFLHRIRPMIEFASTEELVAEVKANIEWVRQNVPL